MVSACSSSLTIDLHAPNYLVTFQFIPSTMFQLLIKDNAVKAKENPKTLYNDYVNASTGQEIRIYRSQPLDLMSEGEIFSLDNMKIKIADFGKGTQIYHSLTNVCLFHRRG
jgi:hypothetical protein